MKDIFNKRQRFSIRKFSVGVASVLIGVSLFAPTQGVLASTENNLATEIGANSERENSTPTVEKKQEAQSSSENRGDISSPSSKDTPKISTRTTELETSGDKENNSLTTRDFVAGEDRSSTPEVRAASNPSEVKKYELTDEYAKQIKAGVIGSEGDKLDSLLLNGPKLSPEAYTDNDYLKDKEELYIYEKGGKKYVGYNSHPLLEDTDGDGIIDSKEKTDEKLKWNVSERDMIMFMELSYRDDNYIDRVLNHKKPLTESELYKKNGDRKPRYEYMMMNRELAPYWKRKKSYHTSSGLDAVLYETKSDFLYLPNGTAQVLAFRGTSDAKDIVADGVLGVGSNPQQGNDAENIMRELAKDKSITNLYLTGHSLGGYLVQRAMVEAYQLAYSDSRVMSPKEQRAYRNFYNNVLKKGTTFNAPKVVTSWVSRREFWQKGLDSKKIAKSGKMTHYIVDNDSTIRKGVSNDSDVVINVGRTSGGHSSRSYFEADLINSRSEFMSGKRISLDGTGYQDKKITTVKSVEKVGETAVYSKRGDDIIKSTTVSMKDPDTGQITKNTLDEVFKKDGAKAKVVVTPLDPSVRYEKDATRAKEEAKVTVSGTPGTNTVTTTYTVNPTDGSLIPHEEPAVVVPSKPTVVKVPAKDEVEYLKEGDDVVKKTTTYAVNASTGALTPTVRKDIASPNGVKSKVVTKIIPVTTRYEADKTKDVGTNTVTNNGSEGKVVTTTSTLVNETNGTVTDGTPIVSRTEMVPKVVKVGAKDKVVETPIEPEVEYVRDGEREVDTPNERVEGAKGKTVNTTTYDVDPKDGHITEHVGNPVVTPAGKTIVKVGAKTKVERNKDDQGRDVIDTTTYEVNPKTGKVTPTTVRTYGTTKEPTVEKRVVPSPVVYEKDDTKEKGTAPTTVKGEDGEDTITTTYTVDPNTGKIIVSEGKPVRTKEPTNTIVKVPAKDKVVETLIEPEVEYVRDGEREVDTPNERVEGTKGKTVTTTTYDVDSKDGHITEHVGTPVVTPAGKTIVKVGAKTKVEQSKDSEGRDVIDTTTYEVNPKTGKVTPTTVRTYGTTKEPTVEKRVVPSPVVYEKDDTKEKGTAPTTVKGEDGEDTITTTYTVDPNTGKIIVSEGKPVRTKEPTNTIVKVPAKDKVVEVPIEPEVEYVRDGEREVDTPNERVEGAKGKTVNTTTYDVDPKDGHITEHVGNPVVTPAGKTIVKVGAKTKVERNKDDQGRDVIDTTTYEVNPKTGKVTPTTVRTYGTTKEPTVEKRVVPSPVVYEKDDTKEKGTAPTTVKGEDGEDTITTTYTVDPNTGKIIVSEGKPVRTKEPTNTIVKVAAKDKVETIEFPSPKKYVKDDTRDKDQPNVEEAGQAGSRTTTTTYSVDPTTGAITETVGKPVVVTPTEIIVKVAAKDKVVETPIEPEVEYVRDGEREVDTPNERVEGAKGKTVITTTYDVDPNDGCITEHVGNSVVTPAGKTIVKVGAKTKVEQSKDSEGRDVIDTTTYEVNPKTGKVTPTTVRTYGTTKEPTVELEQDSKTGDVTVTPKKPDGSTYPPGTKVEIPGKDGNPIVVTIDEDGKGKVPNSDLPNVEKTGTGKITEPGKSSVEVPKVTPFENDVLGGAIALPELMIEVRWIDEAGNVLKSSVKTGSEKDVEHGSIPGYEFVRTVIDENEPVITHSFRKVSGTTNSNPATPPKVTIFENGVLPDSIELPELMIEIRWIDEAGNVLKKSVKTGSEKDAEHGSIPGYEFVRTVIDENEPVITHIFRKVSGSTTPNTIPETPVTPAINGNSGQDTAAPTTSIPDSVIPNVNHEDTTDAFDNGAKSNDSQNVLPNTGTESNATLASLGLLGMLSGIGFIFGKKKED